MRVIGLDIGSTATKGVVLLEDGGCRFRQAPTGWSPRLAAEGVFSELFREGGPGGEGPDCVVATGYGRNLLDWADFSVTEITCHARGAAFMVPGCGLVIDIGGQDSKVIRVDGGGRVLDFAMNDKCAAGTGRFLEVIAVTLGVEVGQLAELSWGCEPLALSSMCTVFAESEVIGLLASGRDRGEIIAGLHQAVARRVAGMVDRLQGQGTVVFTGGVANNEGVRRSLEKQLGRAVVVPEGCQYAGALGAALIGRERLTAGG